MFSKKSLPIVLVFLVAGILFTFNTSGIGNPPDKYEMILQQVTDMLEVAHFNPKKVDDEFSKNIFKKYLEALDPDKSIFLSSDIKDLKKYETIIDDEMHGAKIQFFHAVDAVYTKRVNELNSQYPSLLSTPFQFSSDETIVLDPEKLDYHKTYQARKGAWRKRIKFLTLEKYSDLLDARDKLNKSDSAY